MSIILTPFAKLILLFYSITGSYGASLILFAFVIRLVLFPAFLKGRKGMMGMSSLTEKQKVLQQKYAKNRQKYSEELAKLYEEEGVKPSSGCLWSFLPVLFLMPLYAIIRRPLTYLMGMKEDTFNAVSNLLYGTVKSYSNDQISMAQDVFNNYDKIVSSIPDLANMPKVDFMCLGVNLADTPHLMFWRLEDWATWAVIGLWLIPIVSGVLNVVSMLATNHINVKILGTKRVMDQSMRTTMIIMPLFSLWICFTLPGAMGIYWIANSVFAIAQEYANVPFLKKFMKQQAEQKAKRAEDEKERVKREKLAQAEARKKNAEEMRRIQMERKLNKSAGGDSRIGIRAYARGRTFDADRYPTFPYRDPNEIAKEQWAEAQRQAEEKKNKKGKGKVAPAPVEAPKPAQEPQEPVEMPVEQVPETAAVEVPAAAPVEQPAVPEVQEEEEGFVEESFEPEEEDRP